MSARSLPIYELESDLVRTLRASGRLIVQAPTGSGKSTQIPQMLLQHGLAGEKNEIVVLQPRRLATRMLAKRVAEEMDSPLGGIVGYQIRLESRVSERTRIKFVTEGILLRQMSFDSNLRGIGVIVFDEFHERHLYGDISLARAMQIQQTTRPDLKLIVMSATLDAGALRGYLAPCEVLVSQGRSFPVRIDYLPKSVNFEQEPPWEVAVRECERVAAETTGDMLVFMPGAYEISRTIQAIDGSRALRGFVALPLHGELPPDQQDRAVARQATRKIIVSTNVAETSLTIDGVTAVIDAGLARMARFDPHRGINTLLVEKIAASSADQRAGRAGRTAPGVCVRLWTEREHGQRALQELPEVKRLDLSEVVLTLKASGIDDIGGFPWLEKPDPKALERAETLLADLGAISRGASDGSGVGSPRRGDRDDGSESSGRPFRQAQGPELVEGVVDPALPSNQLRITALGRKMLRFPVHPRYARMFLAAQERGCVRPVALMAALTQGRNFLLRSVTKDVETAREDTLGEEHESDFFLLMRAWRYADKASYGLEACRRLGIHAQGARQVGPLFEQFLAIAEKEGLDISEGRADSVSPPRTSLDPADSPSPRYLKADQGTQIRKCVLAGFSDQLARRLDAGTLRCELIHARRGLLARESGIQKAGLFVAAEISEIGNRSGEVNVLLSLATAIEEPWLKEIFPEDYREVRGVTYDESIKRVVSRRERRFRDLVLESKQSSDEAPLNEAASLLTKEVLAGRLKLDAWDEAVEQWILRVNRLAEWFPELEVNPITESDRATLIEQICYGELGYRGIKDKPVMPVLKDWLTAEQIAVIDDYLPERLTMANGRRSKIAYAKEGPPVLSARIQELYGIEGKFTLGHGRVPVKIEVLAPNHRPIQVTDDLTNFWREQYPKVKAELSRRYPRHEWR